MKKLLLLSSTLFLLMSCGTQPVNGSNCYGLIDKDQEKKEGVSYKVETGNVVWSVVGSGTVAIPVWLIGYRLYCPVK